MTYEMLKNIYVIAGIASLVMLLVTIGLFFLLKIPEAVAFVSGKTRKQGIEAIQRTGTTGSRKTGPKSRKLTKAPKTPVAKVQPDNAPRKQESTTEKLTDILPGSDNPTAVLSGNDRLTTVLDGNAVGGAAQTAPADHRNLVFTQQPFVVEFDITYVSTDMVIGEG